MALLKLDGAVDLHVHSYPCVFQRRVDDRQAAQAAAEAGMTAILLKSHHESTVSRAYLIQKEFPNLKVFGGVVLNQFVGGINPAAAEVSLRLGAKEVWMPTIDAAHHIDVHGARPKSIACTFKRLNLLRKGVLGCFINFKTFYALFLCFGHKGIVELNLLKFSRIGQPSCFFR